MPGVVNTSWDKLIGLYKRGLCGEGMACFREQDNFRVGYCSLYPVPLSRIGLDEYCITCNQEIVDSAGAGRNG